MGGWVGGQGGQGGRGGRGGRAFCLLCSGVRFTMVTGHINPGANNKSRGNLFSVLPLLLRFVLLIRLHYTELIKYSKTTKMWTLQKMMLQSSLAVNRRGIREKEQTRTKEHCLARLRGAEHNCRPAYCTEVGEVAE